MPKTTGPLARYAGFAAVVAASGIPLYIHLPAFLATRYGIALQTLGGLLVVLRLVDSAQDPGLGWLLTRLGRWRDAAVLVPCWLKAAALVLLLAAFGTSDAPPRPIH